MGTRDLINLGLSPDSGTGDSARKGGTKINDLFADIYTQLGDNPINTDKNTSFYGYRRTFSDFEYKVGEIHPAGKYARIGFRTTDIYARPGVYNDSDGFNLYVDSDGNGVPSLYSDSEIYFLNRGELVDIDLTGLSSSKNAHLVLPLANTGDVVRVRESRDSISPGQKINVWTTPFAFKDSDQRVEWSKNSGGGFPNYKHAYIRDYDGVFKNATVARTGQEFFMDSDIPYLGGANATSNIQLTGNTTEYEFVYLGHTQGWVFNTRKIWEKTSSDITIHTDAWDSDQWVQIGALIPNSAGDTIVSASQYMLPLTNGTTGTDRDFTSITKIMNVKVYKKVKQSGDPNGTTVERLRQEMRRVLEAETDSESARAIRFKTALGTEGDSDSTYQTSTYTGFDNVDDLYIEQTLTTIIDNKGNVVVFSSTPFTGAAVILSLG